MSNTTNDQAVPALSAESRRELEELRAQIRAELATRGPEGDDFRPKPQDPHYGTAQADDPSHAALKKGGTSSLPRTELDDLAWTFYDIRRKIEAAGERCLKRTGKPRLNRRARRNQMRRLSQLIRDMTQHDTYLDAGVADGLLRVVQALLATTLAENARQAERAQRQLPQPRARAYRGREAIRAEALRRCAAGEKTTRVATALGVPPRTIRHWQKTASSTLTFQKPPMGEGGSMTTIASDERLALDALRLTGLLSESAEIAERLRARFPENAAVQAAVEAFLEQAQAQAA